MHRLRILLSVFLLSFVSTSLRAEPVNWQALQSLGNTEYLHVVRQKESGSSQSYHVFVRLPATYKDADKQQYPTLYLLDGGINFPLFSAYYHSLRFTDELPEMIIVGISYGSDDFKQGNARSHDFTAPSKERDFWGGAASFETFLRDKLLPQLSKSYPINTEQQILFGQSLGGQFALYTSMYGDSPFAAVIASNPALHRNLEYFTQPVVDKTEFPLTYIISAEFDSPRFKAPFQQWQKHWHNQVPKWSREIQPLADHGHLSATPEALRKGLKWILAQSRFKRDKSAVINQ